jgi:hypothetical protein
MRCSYLGRLDRRCSEIHRLNACVRTRHIPARKDRAEDGGIHGPAFNGGGGPYKNSDVVGAARELRDKSNRLPGKPRAGRDCAQNGKSSPSAAAGASANRSAKGRQM